MPENPRIYMISQGCTANFGEGEQMAGLLHARGFETCDHTNADPVACVLNVCTVKGNGTALKAIRAARDNFPGKPLLVTGCVPPDLVRDLEKLDPSISITSTNALDHVPSLLERMLQGETLRDNARTHSVKVGLPKVRKNPIVGIVSISNGCLDVCSFCSTRIVKGQLQSYPTATIVDEVRALVADGCKEIWLASQDAGCYGFDLGTNLALLVQNILVKVPGDYHIRLGMGNPRHLLAYADTLVETCHDPRVFRFVHLPVQSGSDAVLALMRRKHSVADYYHLVDLFRTRLPYFTLSTDLIVGFPGETRDDFEATLRLVRETTPSVCNRTRYVARLGTPAAKLPHPVHKDEKKERSALLTSTFMEVALKNNQSWIGRDCSILIDEAGKRGTWIGRNECYKPVAVEGNFAIGDRLHVRIHGAEAFALLGTPQDP